MKNRAIRPGEGRKYGTGRACDPLSDTDAAYIAGLIDGEGTIGVTWRKPTAFRAGRFGLHVAVNMTAEVVLDWVDEATGIRSKIGPFDTEGNRAKSFRWAATSSGAYTLLEQVVPYLKLKDTQASLAMRVHAEILRNPGRLRDFEWLAKIKETFHELNAKGSDAWLRKALAETPRLFPVAVLFDDGVPASSCEVHVNVG